MTNGLVAILGPTGRNFGAGMSGGLAFVFDEEEHFEKLLNTEMVEARRVDNAADATLLKELVYEHLDATHSSKAAYLLANWEASLVKFWKVRPKPVAPAPAKAAPPPAATKPAPTPALV